MPVRTKPEPASRIPGAAAVSMLTGWVRQGTESFFATQRILLDLVMRQNANAMKAVQSQFTNARAVTAEALGDAAGEGLSNFIDAQRVLLHLAQRENEIVMTGVQERAGVYPPVVALTDLIRRGVDTYIEMQQHFLTIASKQTDAWIDARKSDKAFAGKGLPELARESMETFVRSQKKFLDVVAEETAVATEGVKNGRAHHDRTKLLELARQGAEAFIDAQKKLLDVATQQMTVNSTAARRAMEVINPVPPAVLKNLSRQTVDTFAEAQQALLDMIAKPPVSSTKAGAEAPHPKAAGRKRAARTVRRPATATA